MTRLRGLSLGTVLLCALASCYAADHFHGDPSQYDDLFFGPEGEAPSRPTVKDDKWRHYAIFDLVAWDREQTRFARNRLGKVAPDSRPMKIVVRSEQSFLNIAASFGVSLVGGILGPLLFVPQTTEVTGWTDG